MIMRTSGGDLAPSLGGRKNLSRTKISLNVVFPEKISIFTPKIFDDLFSFFRHRPGFPDFTFLYCIKCRMRPFLHKKNHYFTKEFLDKSVFYSVRTFAHILQHYFSKYWGDQCMGRPRSSIFLWGPSP